MNFDTISKKSSVIFDVFQIEISGISCNDWQFLNIPVIFLTLEVFHFEISGNDSKDLQKYNKHDMLLMFDVFQEKISGID